MDRPTLSWPARSCARWVSGAARAWPLVLLLALVASVGSVAAIRGHLGIDTGLDGMLSSDLPFRRENVRYVEAFPQAAARLVLVIDGATPEDARAAALALASRLAAREDRFAHVSVPRAEPFLERHALYYLDRQELLDLSDRLVEVQPFLGRLTRDPSLRGLLDMLARAYEERLEGGAADMTRFVEEVDRAADAALEGRPYRTSWQGLMRTDPPAPDDLRQYVLACAVRDTTSLFPAGASLAAARALFAEVTRGLEPAPRLRITGGLAMEHEELQTVRSGAEILAVASFLLVAGAVVVGLGSWQLVVASLVTLVVGLLLTTAFAALAVGHLNLVSVAFGVLYIGLGIDYALHLSLRYREALQHGLATRAALAEAAADTGGSLLLCAATTVLGFYAFIPTAYRGVSELGLIAGTGMIISLAATLTLLPALLVVLRLPGLPPTPRGGFASGVVRRLADATVRHRRGVLAVAALLTLGALFALPSARFDVNPVNLRDPSSESVRTFRDLLATSRTPPWSITLLAQDAAEAQTLATRLDLLPETDRVVTLDSFVPRDQPETAALLDELALSLGTGLLELEPRTAPDPAEQRSALAEARTAARVWLDSASGAGDATTRRLVERLDRLEAALARPDGAAVVLRFEGALLAHLPETLGRLEASLHASPFTREDLPAALARDWRSPGGPWRVEVFPAHDLDDAEALERFVAAVQTVSPAATGAPVQVVASGRAIVDAFRQALLISVLASTLLLVVLLRRPRDVLLVLVPLLFAAALSGAATVVLDVPFNFANVIALPLLFGVGVDGGIHIVHRARGALPDGAGGNPISTSTGRAITFSAVTTVFSFGNLAFSSHPGTASMGLLLTVGMLFMLLGTLVLLPALLAPRRPATGA